MIKLLRTDTTLDLSQKAKRAEEEKKKEEQEFGSWTMFKYHSNWSVHGDKLFGGPCAKPGLGLCSRKIKGWVFGFHESWKDFDMQ